MKKFLCITMLFLVTVLAGCQQEHIVKQKKTKTNDAKVVKTEQLQITSYKDFYESIGDEDWREMDIIQIADQKITAVISNYFLVLDKDKKNDIYKIQKIINLHPYGMAYYYTEATTMFFPSKDGEKYLIYNDSRIDKKDQTIKAKDDKDLKSIVIDLKKDKVTYLKGNHLDHLKKKEELSENNYPKMGKISKDMKKYADQKQCELETNTYLQSGKDRFWVMKPFYEENILAGGIYRYHEGKIKCVFKFEQ